MSQKGQAASINIYSAEKTLIHISTVNVHNIITVGNDSKFLKYLSTCMKGKLRRGPAALAAGLCWPRGLLLVLTSVVAVRQGCLQSLQKYLGKR